ncbi:formylglycine-generating enzyme family protein [Streptomyces rubellomurinus]|uniref:formylglycine-generating enzyme family protein n=1 Tax=Streptomyces rubellomurinus (strain ATCC 31215) TaxID=359131 RepID=UPI0005F0F516|nr:SUMF1/EgtB/PvdO family nonheme iron enzyme [Streptomyces rubellomurinus]
MPGRDMVTVPAGVAVLGSSEDHLDGVAAVQHLARDWFEDETPQHRTPVRRFLLDRHPVTNAQFARFANSTRYRTVAEQRGFGLVYGPDFWDETPGATWRQPTGPNGPTADQRPDHPVVHIAWPDAAGYAAWSGLRLPTETEWEYAARGPHGHLWPWGDTWNPDLAACAEHWAGTQINDGPAWRTWWTTHHHTATLPSTRPVTTTSGTSWCGAAHLAGNVQEWTATTYHPYNPNRTYIDLYQHISTLGTYKVLRGGGWMAFRYQTRGAERIAADPTYSNFTTGFRCAADPPAGRKPRPPPWHADCTSTALVRRLVG